jgi:hypothetical protein
MPIVHCFINLTLKLERKNFEFCFVSQVDGIADMAGGAELVNKLNSLEVENKNLKKGKR